MSSKQIRERCSCLPSVFHGKPLVSPTRRTVVAKLELALQRSADPFSFEATNARGSSGTEVFVDSKSGSAIGANLLALQFEKTFVAHFNFSVTHSMIAHSWGGGMA